MANHEAERAFHGIQNVTGRRYPALMKLLTVMDLFALARDLLGVVQSATRKGAREPWRAF
jgi:hypothetical protein